MTALDFIHMNGSLVLPYRAAVAHAILMPNEPVQLKAGMVVSARMMPLAYGRILAWYDVTWPERSINEAKLLGLHAFDELVPLEHDVYASWYESVTRQNRWPMSSLAHLTCMMRKVW